MNRLIKPFLLFLTVMAVCLLGAWTYLYREVPIRGDDFRKTVLQHDGNSYASWFLYRDDSEESCIKLARPVVPQRFCISKSDLEVRNSDKGGSENGVIYKNELVLKKNRYPGAQEEIF